MRGSETQWFNTASLQMSVKPSNKLCLMQRCGQLRMYSSYLLSLLVCLSRRTLTFVCLAYAPQ